MMFFSLSMVSCFNNPSQSHTLRVTDNIRVHQAGDVITYNVTGTLSYPLLDASNKPVIALGSSNCPSSNQQYGSPCLLQLALEESASNPASLEISWSNYGGPLSSGVTGSPSVNGVLMETWKLTPTNPALLATLGGGTIQTTRYVTQVSGGDIAGQTIAHAYSTPVAVGGVSDTAFFINRIGQSNATVSNAIVDDSPLLLNNVTTVEFNLLTNCTASNCDIVTSVREQDSVGGIEKVNYPNFRAKPTEVVYLTKNNSSTLIGAEASGNIVTNLPPANLYDLGSSFLTQCNTLRIVNGTNPLPQVYSENIGSSFYLFPQLGFLYFENRCRYYQVADLPQGGIVPMYGSDLTNTLSYTWTVTPLNGQTNYTVLGGNFPLAGIFSYEPGDFEVQMSVSDGTLTTKDILYFGFYSNFSDFNTLPVALAGANAFVQAGVGVNLDAGQSYCNNDLSCKLDYSWQAVNPPSGSTATLLSTPNQKTTTFTSNVSGEYRIDLTVTDGIGQTSTDTLFVYVEAALPNPQHPVVTASGSMSRPHHYLVNGPVTPQLLQSSMVIKADFADTNIPIEGR